MLQIVQNMRTGDTSLVTVPAVTPQAGEVSIKTRVSLVSQGTESMLVRFGRASLFEKAKLQPEKVKQALAKMKTDGLVEAAVAVLRKLDEPLPLGYSSCGQIVNVGPGVTSFSVGDRVVSNGPHAELVSIAQNLVAKVPDNVTDEAAAFTIIASIGLQGIRLSKPELGETFVVVGLGLIGQLTAQLLRIHGCRVIGLDFDNQKVTLARTLGTDAFLVGGEANPVAEVMTLTQGLGCDGVIVTASTKSDEVISQAAQMSRKRGRIVLVGVVGLNINRADFYEKELTFQVSCSYGPGRYETAYEDKGLDYPVGFVRWTENRNFQAVLAAMASGALKVEPLITRRVPLQRYSEIYGNMDDGGLASLLVYDREATEQEVAETTEGHRELPERHATASASTIRVSGRTVAAPALAIIGAGNFTKMTAMPALAEARAPVKIILSSGGVTGTSLARKYGVPFSGTDYAAVLDDADVRGVIITTRHNLHAEQTVMALKAGKHVLVEKPLCLTLGELRSMESFIRSSSAGAAQLDSSRECRTTSNTPWVTVGFNRRFSSHIERMKTLLNTSRGPMSVVATMNAGAVPLNHWVHDPEVGGGRLIGEACHFLDLAIFLTGSLIESVSATLMEGVSDCASILLRHENGSNCVVNYLANGHRELSKERVEVHSQGRTLLLDNFRELRGYGFKSFSKLSTKLDKGHARQFGLFAQRVKENGPALIPWAEVANGARTTLAIPIAIAERRWVKISELI